jgi:predicted RNase H-like HicB family nuclease
MSHRIYAAVVDREPGEQNWFVLLPDFPEIASAAENEIQWATQAFDAVATAIEARRADGEELPEPTDVAVVMGRLQDAARASVLLVPVTADASPSSAV